MMNKSLTAAKKVKLAYSLAEMAEATGVSVPLLRAEIIRGNLKPVRIGRRIVVPAHECDRFLEAAEER
jgi:excisionase family DNA binding protein